MNSGFKPVYATEPANVQRPGKGGLCLSEIWEGQVPDVTTFRVGGAIEMLDFTVPSYRFVWALPLDGGVMGGVGFVEAVTSESRVATTRITGTATATATTTAASISVNGTKGEEVAPAASTSTSSSGSVRRGVCSSLILMTLNISLWILVAFYT